MTIAPSVLDDEGGPALFARHRAVTRAGVVAAVLLHAGAPDPGTAMLTAADRTPAGQRLRDEAEAMLTTLSMACAAAPSAW